MTPTPKQLKILRWLAENPDYGAYPSYIGQSFKIEDELAYQWAMGALIPLWNKGLVSRYKGISSYGYTYKPTQAGIDHLKELDNQEEGGK